MKLSIALLSLLTLPHVSMAMSSANVIAAVEAVGEANIREIKPAAHQPVNAVCKGCRISEAIEITVLQYSSDAPKLKSYEFTVSDGKVESTVEISE